MMFRWSGCKCNRSGSCRGCSCVKKGVACSNCLPSRLGNCLHLVSSPVDTLAANVHPSPPVNLVPIAAPSDPPSSSVSDALPSLSAILSLSYPTLHHVPKRARNAWAGIVSEAFEAISLAPSDLEAWSKFFMLARCILANPERAGRTHWRDTEKAVISRIRRWREGDLKDLWSETLKSEERLHKRRRKPKMQSPDSLRQSNTRRARQAMDDGQYKKAAQALTSDGLAPASTEVYAEMLNKHPQSPPPSTLSDPVPSSVTISEEGVIKALRSFPSGTAPGTSCLRANHLKEAVFCPSPARANPALLSLVKVVNCLCARHAPPEVVPHLCGAALFACKKKGGGLHPIAVGEVLRCLTSKCVARAVSHEAATILSPVQLGVGVRDGCEAIVHAVSRVQEDADIPPEDRWTLLLDFSNAFNSVNREAMFKEVRARIPSMAAWMESCYGAQPILHLGPHTILSCCGVQQGDPLVPLGFSLALLPIIEKIQEQVPGLLINAWYLDDGTLCGSADDLNSALAIIESEAPSYGLHLNRSKSLLHIPEGISFHNPLPGDIPITREGFDLLGSPIGSTPYCEASVLRRVQKVLEILSKLAYLQDSQMETTLLRYCLALPKIAFALRTCPPNRVQEASTVFDNAMRDTLSDIAGGPLPEWAWLKASLPSSLGGLTIRRASLHAPAAYLASLSQCSDLVSLGMYQRLPNICLQPSPPSLKPPGTQNGSPSKRWTYLSVNDPSLIPSTLHPLTSSLSVPRMIAPGL